MSNEAVIAVAAMMVTQFSLIWWRLGQIEQRCKNHFPDSPGGKKAKRG